MDLQLLQLAIKTLANDLDVIKNENKTMRLEMTELKRKIGNQPNPERNMEPKTSQDELLTLLQARTILQVCRNVFLNMTKEGVITPIRMHRRTIR
jgi:hypothetical protein